MLYIYKRLIIWDFFNKKTTLSHLLLSALWSLLGNDNNSVIFKNRNGKDGNPKSRKTCTF